MDDEDTAFEDANTQTTTPLSAIAEAFEELSQSVNVYNNKNNMRTDGLRLKPFCDACSLVSVLFGCLGIAFKFAEYEYCSKVRFPFPLSAIYIDMSFHMYEVDAWAYIACANRDM